MRDIRERSDGVDLVFRSPRGKPLSSMTLSKLLKEPQHLRLTACVPVEFSGLGRETAKQASTPREVAYSRIDLERRRRLMDD